MDIGKRLREIRIRQGLSQREFCQNSVTESFYSRVENGKSNIGITNLIKLLDHNHVSLYEFFLPLTNYPFKKQVMNAFFDRNLDALKNYSKSKEIGNYDQLEFKLMLAILKGKTTEISDEEKEKIENQVFTLGKFDTDILFNIGLLISISNYSLVKTIFEYVMDSAQKDKMDNFTLIVLSEIIFNFMDRCLQEKDVKEAKKAISYILKLPNTSILLMNKLKAKACLCDLNGDEDKIDEIIWTLKLCGYDGYICENKH